MASLGLPWVRVGDHRGGSRDRILSDGSRAALKDHARARRSGASKCRIGSSRREQTDGGSAALSQTVCSAGLPMRLDGLAGFAFRKTPSPFPQKIASPSLRGKPLIDNIFFQERGRFSQILITLERAFRRFLTGPRPEEHRKQSRQNGPRSSDMETGPRPETLDTRVRNNGPPKRQCSLTPPAPQTKLSPPVRPVPALTRWEVSGMQCPRCQHENPPNAIANGRPVRFCVSSGARRPTRNRSSRRSPEAGLASVRPWAARCSSLTGTCSEWPRPMESGPIDWSDLAPSTRYRSAPK